jgi:hypothetical protein
MPRTTRPHTLAITCALASLPACEKVPSSLDLAPSYPAFTPPVGVALTAHDHDPNYGCEPDRVVPGDPLAEPRTVLFDAPTKLEWLGEELVNARGGYVLVRHAGKPIWLEGRRLEPRHRDHVLALLARDDSTSTKPACWHARVESFATPERVVLETASELLLVDVAAARHIVLDTLGGTLEGCRFDRSRRHYTCSLDLSWDSVSIASDGSTDSDAFHMDTTWTPLDED